MTTKGAVLLILGIIAIVSGLVVLATDVQDERIATFFVALWAVIAALWFSYVKERP